MKNHEIYDALCEIDEKYLYEFEEILSHEKPQKTFIKPLRRVAVFAVCVASLIAATLSFSARSSADFKSAFMEFIENLIIFKVNPDTQSQTPTENINDISVGYIPSGYALKDKLKPYNAVQYIYENGEKLRFNIVVSDKNRFGVQASNQKSGMEKMQINGKTTYLVYDNGENQYCTMLIVSEKTAVTIYGYVPRKEIIKIARSIENF